jgi:hypothetical protein
MTKPPCKVDGVNCPKRYIGCHADCEAYHKWMDVHAKEKQARYLYYSKTNDADSMAKDTIHRLTKHNRTIKRKVGQR